MGLPLRTRRSWPWGDPSSFPTLGRAPTPLSQPCLRPHPLFPQLKAEQKSGKSGRVANGNGKHTWKPQATSTVSLSSLLHRPEISPSLIPNPSGQDPPRGVSGWRLSGAEVYLAEATFGQWPQDCEDGCGRGGAGRRTSPGRLWLPDRKFCGQSRPSPPDFSVPTCQPRCPDSCGKGRVNRQGHSSGLRVSSKLPGTGYCL